MVGTAFGIIIKKDSVSGKGATKYPLKEPPEGTGGRDDWKSGEVRGSAWLEPDGYHGQGPNSDVLKSSWLAVGHDGVVKVCRQDESCGHSMGGPVNGCVGGPVNGCVPGSDCSKLMYIFYVVLSGHQTLRVHVLTRCWGPRLLIIPDVSQPTGLRPCVAEDVLRPYFDCVSTKP